MSNLRQQAIALGLGDRFEEIEAAYAGADRILGRLVKVTPSSKVVGDLALALVGAGITADEFAAEPQRFDIPDSVIGFLRGELGDPPGGWPEPLRSKALAGRAPAKPQAELTAEDEEVLAQTGPKRQVALNRLLFPGPTKEFEAHRELYGDTSTLSANQFLYGLRHGDEHRVTLERGVELLIGLEAISDADERGMRTVMCIINGQLRPVVVRDHSVASEVPAAEKADRTNPDHVAAPFAGVVTVNVAEGDAVEAGQTIASIEAMKMEAAITAPKAGTVTRVAVSATAQVEGGDLLVVVRSAGRWDARSAGDDRGINLTRIVAGALGGRRIAVPQHRSGRGTRPTTDRVRESLFNLLAARIDFSGQDVLDLYAGSGALGLEALSRGAASALFVESDAQGGVGDHPEHRVAGGAGGVGASRHGRLRYWPAARPGRWTWCSPIRRTRSTTLRSAEMLVALVGGGWCTPGTVAVVERSASGPEIGWPDGWSAWSARRYGATRIELAERD